MRKFPILEHIEEKVLNTWLRKLGLEPARSDGLLSKLGIGFCITFILGFSCLVLGVVVTTIILLIYLVNLVWNLIIYVRDYKKIKNKEKNIRKLISDYENELNNMSKLHLIDRWTQHNTEISTRNSLYDFLWYFFNEYNKRSYTVDDTNTVQCAFNKRRSLGDIYRICRYYYPDITLEQVLKTLISLINSRDIGASRCSTIHKYVFHVDSLVVKYNDALEYSNYYKFQDLVDIYKKK